MNKNVIDLKYEKVLKTLARNPTRTDANLSLDPKVSLFAIKVENESTKQAK